MRTINIKIKINTEVLYHGEECKVVWIYDSGFCEIYADHKVRLVKMEELEQLEHDKKAE